MKSLCRRMSVSCLRPRSWSSWFHSSRWRVLCCWWVIRFVRLRWGSRFNCRRHRSCWRYGLLSVHPGKTKSIIAERNIERTRIRERNPLFMLFRVKSRSSGIVIHYPYSFSLVAFEASGIIAHIQIEHCSGDYGIFTVPNMQHWLSFFQLINPSRLLDLLLARLTKYGSKLIWIFYPMFIFPSIKITPWLWQVC